MPWPTPGVARKSEIGVQTGALEVNDRVSRFVFSRFQAPGTSKNPLPWANAGMSSWYFADE